MAETFKFSLTADRVYDIKVQRPKISDPTDGQEAGVTYLSTAEAITGPYLDDEDETRIDVRVTPRQIGQLVQVALEPVRPPTDGLLAWYDASELSLDDGDEVTSFADKSGNGWDVEQLGTGSVPSYFSEIINGLPGIGGPGTDLFLQGDGSIENDLSEYYCFAVCYIPSGEAGDVSTDFRFTGTYHYVRSVHCSRSLLGGLSDVGGIVTDYSSYDRYSGGFSWDAASEYLNAVMVSLPTDYTQAAVFKDAVDLEADFALRNEDDVFPSKSGDARIALQFTNAYVGEVLMYGRALMDDERSQVFEYLMHKYQI